MSHGLDGIPFNNHAYIAQDMPYYLQQLQQH